MPIIADGREERRVTTDEANRLLDLGLIFFANPFDQAVLHLAPDGSWAEIAAALAAAGRPVRNTQPVGRVPDPAVTEAGAMKVLTVVGTRPEAIKMAPVIRRLEREPGIRSVVCVTGQHREMLDQVLTQFGVRPDFDLDIMASARGLHRLTGGILTGLQEIIGQVAPDRVLVQGDTTTTLSAALAAFYSGVPTGHVEAGLRTGDIHAPWPEEMNRRLTTALSDLHFAPTEQASRNLLAEGVDPARILVTGNTGVDALRDMLHAIDRDEPRARRLAERFAFLDDRRTILVTGHRRENLHGGLARVCRALARLARRADVRIVFPVHLNPQARATVHGLLAERANVHLIEPLDYENFVYLMARSHLIVTDSGGIQEEAPSLGKPVLVTRETSERPEAVAAGTARLVGTDPEAIVAWAERLLDDDDAYRAMSFAHNPYGDGRASDRIARRLRDDAARGTGTRPDPIAIPA